MFTAKTKLLLLLLMTILALPGCVDGSYDDGYYSNRGYRGGGGHGGGYYDNDDPYRQRQKRVQANCNMNWQNCVNICNQIADANHRMVCVANCNNARNACINN